jgi:hypothetical protein
LNSCRLAPSRVPDDQSVTSSLPHRASVAVAQRPGHVGQPGREQEHLAAVALDQKRVEKPQQHLRVAAHRARDLAQRDDRRRPILI